VQNNLSAQLRESISPRRPLGRLVIVTAVLLLSALVAYRAPGGRMALVLIGLPPAVLAAAFLIRRPGAGLILLVVAGLVVPFSIGTGTGTSLNPTIFLVPALTALWVVDMAIRRKAVRLHHHAAVYLALGLTIVAVVAFISGQLPWFDLPGAGLAPQLGGLFVYVLSVAAFLLAAHIYSVDWLQRLVYVFLAVGAVYLIGRILPPLSPVLRLFANGSSGSVFWIWLAAFSGGLALFQTNLSFRWRLALAALAATTLLVAYLQAGNWASGWAPPLVALLLLLWLRYSRWGWLALLLATLLFFIEFERFWFLATDSESWLARRQAWQIVLDTARVNPILGLGPSNYYFYVRQADIAGWGGVWNVEFSSHNNWVDIIAQTGILGLSIVLAFAFSMGRVGLRLFRVSPDGFPRAYAAASVAGLVATLVSGMLGDWFLPFIYNIGLNGMRSSILFWVFMGGLLSLYMNPGLVGRKTEPG
jgi:O-antigen ligase